VRQAATPHIITGNGTPVCAALLVCLVVFGGCCLSRKAVAWETFGNDEHGRITRRVLSGLGYHDCSTLDLLAAVGAAQDFVDDFYSPGAHFDRPCGESTQQAFNAGLGLIRSEALLVANVGSSREHARLGLGRMLHAIQDAYSHSNYVDLSPASRQQIDDAIDGAVTAGLAGADLNVPALPADFYLTAYDPREPGPLRYFPCFDSHPHGYHFPLCFPPLGCISGDAKDFPFARGHDEAIGAAIVATASAIGLIETHFGRGSAEMGSLLGARTPFYPLSASLGCAESGDGPDVIDIETITSSDPNDITGPRGLGIPRYIVSAEVLDYSIHFENMATASAPAQQVHIADRLDVPYDILSVAFGPVLVGDTLIIPPVGPSWSVDVDMRPKRDMIIRIAGRLDVQTRSIEWSFAAIDPATGELVDDPLGGFLPPNTSPPNGEGQVFYSVGLAPGASGAELQNKALIVFDANPALETPVWSNRIDDAPPTTFVSGAQGEGGVAPFRVAWMGQDNGSGLKGYSVFVSKDGGPFEPWQQATDDTSAMFAPTGIGTYAIYSVGEDSLGNVEDAPDAPDVVVVVATTETVVANGSLELQWDGAHISWRGLFDDYGYKLFRVVDGVAPAEVGPVYRRDRATLEFIDDSAVDGQCTYRLVRPNGDVVGEVTGVLATRKLSFQGFLPNPSRGGLEFGLALPDARPGTLQVFDVGGRRIVHQEVRASGPGMHVVRLVGPRLVPGMYFVKLQHGGREIVRRGIVMR